jgi:arylsulfatase A-like enzyme
LVQGIDIPATILDAAGGELPETFQGKSLLPLAQGTLEKSYDYTFTNQGLWQAKRIISDGKWKLIKALDNGFWPAPELELYDLDSDPKELTNLVEKEPHIAADLELRLRRWEDAQLRGGVDPLRKIVDMGLPTKPFVEAIARRSGEMRWEDFRSLIDVPFKEAERHSDTGSHPAGLA